MLIWTWGIEGLREGGRAVRVERMSKLRGELLVHLTFGVRLKGPMVG